MRLAPAPRAGVEHRSQPRRRALFVAALLPLLCADEARAADCVPFKSPTQTFSPCIDADNLWPHAGGGSYFAIGDTATTPRGALAFGVVGSYLTQPIGLVVARPTRPGPSSSSSTRRFDATLLFALGVTDRLRAHARRAGHALPERRRALGVCLSALQPAAASAAPQRAARHALRLRGAAPGAAAQRRRAGPALTGRLEFAVPTGDERRLRRGPHGGDRALARLLLPPRPRRHRRRGLRPPARRGDVRQRRRRLPGRRRAGHARSTSCADRWLSAGAEAFALYTTSKQLPDPRDADQVAGPPRRPAGPRRVDRAREHRALLRRRSGAHPGRGHHHPLRLARGAHLAPVSPRFRSATRPPPHRGG